MAERSVDGPAVRAEDVLQVGTRVSWGAILAGAIVAMAVHVVLTLLGAAFGFSLMKANETSLRTVSLIGASWCIFSCAISFFIGGWVATQVAVGENRTEAIIHAVATWGVGTALMFLVTAMALQTGIAAAVGADYFSDRPIDRGNWEKLARQAGLDDEQIERGRARLDQGLTTDENKEAARKAAAMLAWWLLGATLISMAATILGGIAGSGPEFHLMLTGRGAAYVVAGSPRNLGERVGV